MPTLIVSSAHTGGITRIEARDKINASTEIFLMRHLH